MRVRMKYVFLMLLLVAQMVIPLQQVQPVQAATLSKRNGAWLYYDDAGRQTDYTGLVKYNRRWYYVENGKVNFQATTLCKYGKKWYYVENGKVNFRYNGTVEYKGKEYTVKNGVKVGRGRAIQEKSGSKTLVVYFSVTGNTKPLAENVAKLLDADLYELVPEDPYTDADIAYYTNSRADKENEDPDARPAIAGTLPDVSGYDTVVLAHPIWYGQAPKILYTFLDQVDLSGKTVTTFCTSASSPLGTSAANLQKLEPDAVWLASRRFPAGAGEENLKAWLTEIGLYGKKDTQMTMTIDGKEVQVAWEKNDAVQALMDTVAKNPITVKATRYGGFEQVGSLGTSITRADAQTTTAPGDIVLYQGNQIVVFFGSNSWSYTRLGKLTGYQKDEIKNMLDKNAVTIELRMK